MTTAPDLTSAYREAAPVYAKVFPKTCRKVRGKPVFSVTECANANATAVATPVANDDVPVTVNEANVIAVRLQPEVDLVAPGLPVKIRRLADDGRLHAPGL